MKDTHKNQAKETVASAKINSNAGLDKLYREAGHVEPEPGLDRMIRARAEEAATTQKNTRRLPWIGGLVTASVAAIAVVIAVQLPPPDGSLPEALSVRPVAEPAESAPPAKPGPQSNSMNRQTRSANAPASATFLAPQPARESMADAETSRQREPQAPLADEVRAVQFAGDMVHENKSNAAEWPAPEIVAMVRALLAQNDIEGAREWARKLKQLHPDHRLPNDLAAKLDDPSVDSPEPPQ